MGDIIPVCGIAGSNVSTEVLNEAFQGPDGNVDDTTVQSFEAQLQEGMAQAPDLTNCVVDFTRIEESLRVSLARFSEIRQIVSPEVQKELASQINEMEATLKQVSAFKTRYSNGEVGRVEAAMQQAIWAGEAHVTSVLLD